MAAAAVLPSASTEATKQLIDKNHEEYALLKNGALHNHLPHILASVTAMGGTPEHLQAVFDVVAEDLEPWAPTSTSIENDEQLYKRLGDKAFEHTFVKYFSRRLEDFQGDWKALVRHYLVDCDKPLLSGTVGGFGHPLILFADAFDAGSSQLAVEALALTAVDYNPLHMILDAPNKPTDTSLGALDVLERIRKDNRFDGLLSHTGVGNTMVLLKSEKARSALMEHFRSFNTAVTTREQANDFVHELIHASVMLLVAVYEPASPHKLDFYLTHQLTFCWSLRVLIPELPEKAMPVLVGTAWLLMVLTYITQLRPPIVFSRVSENAVEPGAASAEWERLRLVALDSAKDRGMDPHFVKVIRTLAEFAQVWPEDEAMFLNSCIAFERDFDGWTGFDPHP